MTSIVRILATFVLALAVGAVVGWSWLAPKNEPPALSASASPAVSALTPTSAEIPHARAAGADHRRGRVLPDKSAKKRPASAREPTRKGEEPSAVEPAEVLVPAQTDKQGDDDVDLLPRGPDAWVLVDLAAAGAGRLTVRAGALQRDGAGAWRTFARAKRVGTLRGKQVRVALLHLGFDREGQPVVAHIRTQGATPIEGVIPLRLQDRRVLLRRIPTDPDPVDRATP